MEGFFLGSRGLGAWDLALTVTVQSGGTFMGFPSRVDSFGWIVAFWAASYRIGPLTGFPIVGKRIAQLSRLTNAVTVPDLLRSRFDDPRAGLVSSLLILFFYRLQGLPNSRRGPRSCSTRGLEVGFCHSPKTLTDRQTPLVTMSRDTRFQRGFGSEHGDDGCLGDPSTTSG